MFMFHIAFALELIALAMGVLLIVWAMQHPGLGSGTAKIFGYIITILSILVMCHTISESVRIWHLRNAIGNAIMIQQHKRHPNSRQ